MRIKLKYGDRDFTLKSYNVKTERDLLFLMEPENINEILVLVNEYIESNINLSNITESEKYFLCYMLRAISVSESVELNIKCEKCNSQFNKKLNIDDFLINNPECKQYFENPDDYYNEELDLIDLNSDVPKIEINFIKSFKCPQCNEQINVNFKDLNILSKIFSESDIQSFYKEIASLVNRGNFDLAGIYNDMLPIERKLYIDVINDLQAEANKKDGLNLTKKL